MGYEKREWVKKGISVVTWLFNTENNNRWLSDGKRRVIQCAMRESNTIYIYIGKFELYFQSITFSSHQCVVRSICRLGCFHYLFSIDHGKYLIKMKWTFAYSGRENPWNKLSIQFPISTWYHVDKCAFRCRICVCVHNLNFHLDN